MRPLASVMGVYRTEIDGLRSVAVVPVVMFHAGLPGFDGGYIGVDVFFVISGFLITSLITPDIQRGTFSLRRFYAARVRRIAPAMLVVIVACIPFAWWWMPAEDLASFSGSVTAASIFVSNLFFWLQTGYFDRAGEVKPLLHTWSLGVEAQFYLVYAVILQFSLRFGRRRVVALLAALALASFLLSEWVARVQPSMAFYLLPTRAWELLSGAVCAFLPQSRSRIRCEFLSVLGLSAICWSVVFDGHANLSASFFLLIPVLGTCLVLVNARGMTATARILSLTPLTAIGAMSYSVYLWHQPLFAFARIRFSEHLTAMNMLALCFCSFAIGYVSWRFIEVPTRRAMIGGVVRVRALFAGLAAATLSTVAFGVAGSVAQGFPQRFPVKDLATRLQVNTGLGDECEGPFKVSPACATSSEPEVLLWGDSFAMHLLDGLRASNPSVRLVQFTQSVCGPIVGIAPVVKENPLTWSQQCITFNDQVLRQVAQTKSLRYAVLSSPFTQFVGKDARILTREGTVLPGGMEVMDAFSKTLETLVSLGIQPVVFAPPPRPGYNAGSCLATAVQRGEPTADCSFSRAHALGMQVEEVRLLQEIEKNYRVVWLTDAICENDTCNAAKDGVFIYRDSEHLSHEGSTFLGLKMDFYGILSATAATHGGALQPSASFELGRAE